MLIIEQRIDHIGHVEIVLPAFNNENGQLGISFCEPPGKHTRGSTSWNPSWLDTLALGMRGTKQMRHTSGDNNIHLPNALVEFVSQSHLVSFIVEKNRARNLQRPEKCEQ